MNVLVTGATGFIGRYLTQRLVNDGYNVFALVRRTSRPDFLNSLGVGLIYGDLTDEKSLRNIPSRKIEAIFHCAAHGTHHNWRKLYAVNVAGTENICRLSLRMGVERLLYLSSVAVVSGNDAPLLTEDLPYCATSLYGRSKLCAEKKVVEFRGKGLRAAIIRPPMVYGEGEPHALGKILFLLKHRLLPLVEGGQARWQLAYVGNVVEGLLLALSKDECLKGALFLADEEALSAKEIFSTLSRAIKAPLPYSLPSWLTPLFIKAPNKGTRYKFFIKDRLCDLSRIKSIGYNPQYHAKESLVKSAVYWLEHNA